MAGWSDGADAMRRGLEDYARRLFSPGPSMLTGAGGAGRASGAL